MAANILHPFASIITHQQQQEESAIIPTIEQLLEHPIMAVIKAYEGWSSTPYLCPAGYWTIGYGHLCDRNHAPITREQGDRYLAQDLHDALGDIRRLAPILETEPDYRAVALASWVMNLGKGNLASSTMLKRIRAGEWEAAAKEMRRWDKATVNGKKQTLPGLTRRRKTEAHLFLTGEAKTFPL